jgi:hypothetical protein
VCVGVGGAPQFAEFEEMCHEMERARMIYKYALDHIPKAQATQLYRRFVTFEKQHGDRDGIEDVIVAKRRFQYEEEVRAVAQPCSLPAPASRRPCGLHRGESRVVGYHTRPCGWKEVPPGCDSQRKILSKSWEKVTSPKKL